MEHNYDTLMTRRQALRGAAASAAALSAGGLLTACGSSGASGSPAQSATGIEAALPSGTPKRGGTLRASVNGGGTSDTLDPNLIADNMDYARAINLYEPLGARNLDFVTEPLLAEEITPNGTGSEWTVRVKDGVEFHNGKTLGAEDVIFTFQRILNPKAPGIGAGILTWIDAGNIKKLDKRTVRFALKQPVSFFDQAVQNYIAFILPVGYDPHKPVGTGPFQYVSLAKGDRSVFKRFPNYWNTPAWVDELVLIDIDDANAAVNALLSGQIDAVTEVAPSQIPAVTHAGARIVQSTAANWDPLVMRCDRPPFTDIRVRQAFRLICDRKQMIASLTNGHARLGNDLYAPYDPDFASQLPQREHDIDQAKSLLKAAGQSDLRIVFETGEIATDANAMGQVFAQQAQAAGVTVQVRQMDPSTFFSQFYLKATFSPDTWQNDGYLYLSSESQIPGAPYPDVHFTDAPYQALYKQAIGTLDQAKRRPILQEMQRIQYERGGFIIWGFRDSLDAISGKLGGFKQNTKANYELNSFGFKNAYFL
jgi:peptide/nickel transport system substrate-binding protein